MNCALGRLPSTAAGSWRLGPVSSASVCSPRADIRFRRRLGFAFPPLAAAGIRSCPVPRLIATAGAVWTGAQVIAHGLADDRSC